MSLQVSSVYFRLAVSISVQISVLNIRKTSLNLSPFSKHKNNVFESHDLELHIKLDRSGGATSTKRV
jgi:hypothetical protein